MVLKKCLFTFVLSHISHINLKKLSVTDRVELKQYFSEASGHSTVKSFLSLSPSATPSPNPIGHGAA